MEADWDDSDSSCEANDSEDVTNMHGWLAHKKADIIITYITACDIPNQIKAHP